MSSLAQDQIIKNTKTVLRGLETLKAEHDSLLLNLPVQSSDEGTEILFDKEEEQRQIIQRSLVNIEMGIGEAHLMMTLFTNLSTFDAEKQKMKSQVQRLCQENAWLREELSSTQQKLQLSEQNVVQLEEEKKHLEYMNSLKVYESCDDDSDIKSRSSRSNCTGTSSPSSNTNEDVDV